MDNHKFVITIYANMKRPKSKFCCWLQLIVPGQLCIIVQVQKRGQIILKSSNTVSDHGLPVGCHHAIIMSVMLLYYSPKHGCVCTYHPLFHHMKLVSFLV